ncbi:mediator complex subunit MED14 family protein [Planoprotostelium fungivorum]|uniref:Mediator of RNA polymerase II transcription subunit 14 n=1 Tax=Planoprotostelium fungivorum TaxID=1890364 RepID=A0A2P6NNV4_9EUKA|nr:mediator complex subunit MED14 family protein [Planoprotostelium fungivorum]
MELNMDANGFQPQYISFGAIINGVVQQTYQHFGLLINSSGNLDDLSKKERLRAFLLQTRVLMSKLYTILQWIKARPDHTKQGEKRGVGMGATLLSKVNQEIMSILEVQNRCFQMAADTLCNVHLHLRWVQEPSYDLNTAVDVLLNGSYLRLPTSLQGPLAIKPPSTDGDTKKYIVQKLGQLIDAKLSATEVPPVFSSIRIENGCAVLEAAHEFEVHLGIEVERDMWTVIKVDIKVSSDRAVEGAVGLNYENWKHQNNAIRTLAASRMEASTEPLLELYHVVHTFCIDLQLYVLYSQSYHLKKTKPNLNFYPEYSPNKLTIRYWTHTPSQGQQRILEISAETNELTIRHHPEIIDLTTKQSRQWKMQHPDALNLEAVLEEIILSSSQTQFHQLQDALQKENGRYNLIGRTKLVSEGYLKDMEDKLNQDITQITEIVRKIFHIKLMEFYEQAAHSARLIPTRYLPTKAVAEGLDVTEEAIHMRFSPPFHDFFLVVDINPSLSRHLYLLKTKPNTTYPAFVDVEKYQTIERTAVEDVLEPRPLPVSACYQILERACI